MTDHADLKNKAYGFGDHVKSRSLDQLYMLRASHPVWEAADRDQLVLCLNIARAFVADVLLSKSKAHRAVCPGIVAFASGLHPGAEAMFADIQRFTSTTMAVFEADYSAEDRIFMFPDVVGLWILRRTLPGVPPIERIDLARGLGTTLLVGVAGYWGLHEGAA